MNIEYYYKKIDPLDNNARDYIEKKLKSIAKITRVRDVFIEISQRKDNHFYMNVTLRTTDGEEYRAEEKNKTINACIDIIKDDLKRQVQSDKERARDLARRKGRSLKKKMTIDDDARI